jgi:xanthine/uracil/vitamin C permease (AzgA family)
MRNLFLILVSGVQETPKTGVLLVVVVICFLLVEIESLLLKILGALDTGLRGS